MPSTDTPTPTNRYAELTWPEVAEWVARDPVLVIPVATLEDHGYHLPIDTDVVIAETLADRAVTARPGTGASSPDGDARLHAPSHGLPGPDHDRLEDVRRPPRRHRPERAAPRLPADPLRERARIERAAGRHGRAAHHARGARGDRRDVLVPQLAGVGRAPGADALVRGARRDGPRLRARDVALPRDPARAGADGPGGARDPRLGVRPRLDGLVGRAALGEGPVERLDRVGRDRRRDGRDGREGPHVARAGRREICEYIDDMAGRRPRPGRDHHTHAVAGNPREDDV